MNQPYVIITVDRIVEDFVCVPISGLSVLFNKHGDKGFIADKALTAGTRQCEYLVSPDGSIVLIRSLFANSFEEFWLKVSAAGLVYGEDPDSKLFSDAEKECVALKTKVNELEQTIKQYRSRMLDISNELRQNVSP